MIHAIHAYRFATYIMIKVNSNNKQATWLSVLLGTRKKKYFHIQYSYL